MKFIYIISILFVHEQTNAQNLIDYLDIMTDSINVSENDMLTYCNKMISHFISYYNEDTKQIGYYYRVRGDLMYMKGAYSNAISDYTSSLDNDKNHIAYFNLGVTNILLGNDTAAISNFTEAINLKNNESKYFLNRGISYFNESKYNLAIEDFKYCLYLNDNSRNLYYFLSKSYFKLNKTTDSEKYWMKYIEICKIEKITPKPKFNE